MKVLLIVFGILLLLLTLLSTFGGSIRPGEPFYQPMAQPKEYFYEYDGMSPAEPHAPSQEFEPESMNMSEQFSDLSPADYPISEQFKSAAPQPPIPAKPPLPSLPSPIPEAKRSEEFANMPKTPFNDGFSIEPYESEGDSVYASF